MASPSSRLSKSNVLGALAYDLASPIISEGAQFLKGQIGNVVRGGFNTARDAAYDRLTHVERRDAPAGLEKGQLDADKTYGGLRSGTEGTKWKSDILDKIAAGEFGEGRGEWNKDTGAHSGIEYRAGRGDQPSQFLAHFAKTKVPKFLEGVYKNPEAVANIAGVAGVAAPIALAGAGIGMLGSDQRYSDYSVPISGGGYNQSVESAAYATMYKQQLEEQKHQHKLELQGLREQSRVPGVQNLSTGGYGGLSSGMDMGSIQGTLEKAYGNRPSYY